MKSKAAENAFRPAGQIVREALRELAEIDEHVRVKPANLLRAANRHRQAMRPNDPRPDQLDFEVIKQLVFKNILLRQHVLYR